MNRDDARKDYEAGMTYRELAEKYNVAESTINLWRKKYNWTPKPNKTAPKGNQYAKGNKGNKNASGPPKGSQNAKKHGLFSKYIPQETLEIMGLLDEGITQSDILWAQIKIQYASIIRAQSIMWVDNHDDITRTITKIRDTQFGTDTDIEVQQAWDKYSTFLTAQSRAQAELRNLIKQFNDLAHDTDERRLKLEQMQLNIDKTKVEISNIQGDSSGEQTIIVNDTDEMRRILDERSENN
jgi:uncharacterized protein YjcR